ncbi:hypothetical protein [Fictibacillus gelatini]|uniref:hypothetical protein n=1 Tax=Fictibacillus gelatini TaxID=225985 RepID=UPI000418A23B|nr:hypothetical protein [Fictibacillus gelatini]
MKGKLVLTLSLAGVLGLSIGLLKDFQTTKVFAQSGQSKVEEGQIFFTNDGDVSRVVTKEEQENRESMLSPKMEDQKTVITAEEQNIVENSSTLSGFMEQENGQGFFFKKE